MLQALLGRSKAPRAAPKQVGNGEAGGQESGEFGDEIDGAKMEMEQQGSDEGAQHTIKRKRLGKKEAEDRGKRGNCQLLQESIHVATGSLLKDGVKSQEGQEEQEEDEAMLWLAKEHPLPYPETPFGVLPPEMVFQIFDFFLDDLPFLVRNIGLTCRYWHDMASSNPLWKRVVECGDFHHVLSWLSPDPASATQPSAPPETETAGYKDLYCEYSSRIRDNWQKGSYSIKVLTGHREFIRFDKNHRAVSSGVDRTVCVWDLKTGACIRSMKGHTAEVDSVDFHEDTVITGSFDSTVRFWDIKTGECTNVLKEAASILMWCVHLFPESNKVLCPGSVASLALWDSEKRKVLHRYINPTSANVMSMYACGRSIPMDPLLTGSSDKIVRLWDTETGLCKLEMSGHTDSIWAVRYEQGAAITASSDRTVKMWDIRSGKCVETLRGHSGTVFCMWAAGGHIVSGDSNDSLFVWEMRQRRRLQCFKEHEGGLRALQNDSYKIVTASWDKTIKVWSFV